jgi:hypothetical protein
MKKKNKKVASGEAVFLLIWHEQFALQLGDAMGIELLASRSIGATCYGHALTCAILYRRGWVVCVPRFA